MRNIKMIIQYDGSRYNGWQKQNQKGSVATTIQGKLENVLSKMTDEEVNVIGCGRTDSGVHAENYVANFVTESKLSLEEMEKYIKEYLPEDIVIKEIKTASNRFHSRFSAVSKTYIYRINNLKHINVFTKKYTYHVPEKLNIEKMKEAAQLLVGTHDFRSFTNLKAKSNKSTVKTINYIDIRDEDGEVRIEINGNGFLLNMVRIITGSLIDVGLGVIRSKEIERILEAKDRKLAGLKVPGRGLTLKEIEY